MIDQNVKTPLFAVLAIMSMAGAILADEARPISITFPREKEIPFPRLALGGQDELWELPYMTDGQWQELHTGGVSLLRFPGGTPSDWYLWDMPDKTYWPNKWVEARQKMTADEFVTKCRANAIEPLLTVNTSSYATAAGFSQRINPTSLVDIQRGARYAARWVEDINVKKKLGVKYWEIGNEVWIWLYPKEYAVYVREYSKAMKAVDPTIKILACGLDGMAGPYYVTWLNFPEDPKWKPREVVRNNPYEWNKTLLTDAAGSFELLVQHPYLNAKTLDPIGGTKEVFARVAENRPMDDAIAWIRESGLPVRIAVTEWMVNFNWEPGQKGAYQEFGMPNLDKLSVDNTPAFSFGTMLVSADFLGKMISTGCVDIGVAHTVREGLLRRMNIQKNNERLDPAVPMPAGVALKFWSQFANGSIVPVKVENDPYYVVTRVQVPKVSAYAVRQENKVSLILINRTTSETLPVPIPDSFRGASVAKASVQSIEADSWSVSLWDQVSKPAQPPMRTVRADLDVKGLAGFQLKPNSLVCVELQLGTAAK